MERPEFLSDQQLQELKRCEAQAKDDLFVMVEKLLKMFPQWSPRQAQMALLYNRLKVN